MHGGLGFAHHHDPKRSLVVWEVATRRELCKITTAEGFDMVEHISIRKLQEELHLLMENEVPNEIFCLESWNNYVRLLQVIEDRARIDEGEEFTGGNGRCIVYSLDQR